MLDELITLTHSLDFEEYGELDLRGATCDLSPYDPDNHSEWQELDVLMTLSLNLDTGADTDAQQKWEVECRGMRGHQILLGQCNGLDFYDDHVLLWDYNLPKASMSFYGEAREPLAVVIALINCHSDLTGDCVPFDRYINGNPLEMIAGRYGMLADGPLPLIEAYAKVLESFGIGTRIANRGLDVLDDTGVFSGRPKAKVLVLKRGCFVVASLFNARRLA